MLAPKSSRRRSTLTTLIELADSLANDTASIEQKQQRDRHIALYGTADVQLKPTDSTPKVGNDQLKPTQQIHRWLDAISPPASQARAQRSARAWRLSQTVFLLLGFVLGIGIGAATLYYDGTQPINIVDAWLILVALPFLMWLLWLTTLLPFRLPIISALSELIQHSFFEPLQRWLHPKFAATSVAQADAETPALNNILNTVSGRWSSRLLGVLMQQFALGVTLGSLLALLYLLTSSDLAFAWSTTLAVTADQIHQLTTILSTPFAELFTNSRPTATLVEHSQFFRLEDTRNQQFTAPETAGQLTQWWPFLAASMLFYAVLPRVLSIWLSKRLFRSATHSEILTLPGASALLARMNAPLVSSISPETQPDTAQTLSSTSSEASTVQHWSLNAPLVFWGRLDVSNIHLIEALNAIGLTVTKTFEAGGANTLEKDLSLIKTLQAAQADGYLVAVKAWEPPMLEFRDWLSALRQQHENAPIIVVLIDAQEGLPSDNDTAVWRSDLDTLHDPHLHLERVALSL